MHKALLNRYSIDKAIRHALQAGLALSSNSKNATVPLQAAEITVRVVHAQEAQTLNLHYRGKDYATNVLTFDYATAPVLCADIVLCAAVLEREALEQGKDLRAHYLHMLVHATLHAMGYDHERSKREAKAMEALEILILQGLSQPNPYEA